MYVIQVDLIIQRDIGCKAEDPIEKNRISIVGNENDLKFPAFIGIGFFVIEYFFYDRLGFFLVFYRQTPDRDVRRSRSGSRLSLLPSDRGNAFGLERHFLSEVSPNRTSSVYPVLIAG